MLWAVLILSLGFGIWTIFLACELEFAPRMESRFRLKQRDAARDGELEALDRIEDAYRAGRQVVSALDRIAGEIENGRPQ